jgi:dihydrofolate reductase
VTKVNKRIVVLTRVPPAEVPKGKSSFAFCTNVQEAVDAAKRQAKEKDVMVHGDSTTQPPLAAGLANELIRRRQVLLPH